MRPFDILKQLGERSIRPEFLVQITVKSKRGGCAPADIDRRREADSRDGNSYILDKLSFYIVNIFRLRC